MADLTKLSAAKLTAVMEKRAAVSSHLTRELIVAGYGSERCSQTRQRAEETGDALAVAYVAATDACQEAYDEKEKRTRYHGSMKPIKRVSP